MALVGFEAFSSCDSMIFYKDQSQKHFLGQVASLEQSGDGNDIASIPQRMPWNREQNGPSTEPQSPFAAELR